LASCVGTGNLVGVATAITLGGPGSIFWMWFAAFWGMMTMFAENILGVKYRTENKKGEVVGGPMHYIEKGLHSKWLAVIFSSFCIFFSLGMGNMAQVNSIAVALNQSFGVPTKITGIISAVLVLAIIFGGINRITKFTEKFVPFMAIFYILGGSIVIFSNINAIPGVFYNIFRGAFDFGAIAGGTTGFLLSNTIKYGILRGLLSNEAGLGNSSIIHSSSNVKEPVEQGMWGIFQVFIDTIIICTVTALCILSTGVYNFESDGLVLTDAAFGHTFGNFGSIFVDISLIFFAFSTLISCSYYGERSIEYIVGESFIPLYKSIYIVLIMFGSVINLKLVFSICDACGTLMAIPNLIALLFLSKEVISETKNYINRINKTKPDS
jgi:AGCS family alanine or glycine:cation symporter